MEAKSVRIFDFPGIRASVCVRARIFNLAVVCNPNLRTAQPGLRIETEAAGFWYRMKGSSLHHSLWLWQRFWREQRAAGCQYWKAIAERRVRSLRVVFRPPLLGLHPRLLQRTRDFSIQILSSQLAVKGLAVAVFPEPPRFDAQRSHARAPQLLSHLPSREFEAIDEAKALWNSSRKHHVSQGLDHFLDMSSPPQVNALSILLIQKIPATSARGCLATHTVIYRGLIASLVLT